MKNTWLTSFFMLMVSSVLFSQDDLSRGLVAYFPFNNNSNDESGNGNHGIAHGIQFTRDFAGRANAAASFNGSNSYIEIPASPGLNSTKLLTVAMKFYVEGPVEPRYLLQRGKKESVTSAKEMYHLRFSPLTEPREIDFNVWEPESCKLKFHLGTVASSRKLADNYEWHCVVGVFDGRSVILYVDGIASASAYPKQPLIEMCTGDFPIYLGAPVSKYFSSFKGVMDEVRIYNRALSNTEVDLYAVDCGRPAPMVIADFSASSDECFPAKIRFNDKSIIRGTAIVNQFWDFGDGHSSKAADPEHEYKETGTYSVRYEITDNGGVIHSDTLKITIDALRKKFVSAGPDITSCKKEPVKLTATGGETYNWAPCNSLIDCTAAEQVILAGTAATYTLTGRDAMGCIDVDTVTVKYIDPQKQLFIPNAFTPDGDGLNDFFKPVDTAGRTAFMKWAIYNRYGQLLFEAKDMKAKWDGMNKGIKQPAGIYTVITQLAGTSNCPAQKISSTLTVIR